MTECTKQELMEYIRTLERALSDATKENIELAKIIIEQIKKDES